MSSAEVFYFHKIDNYSTAESVSALATQALAHEAGQYPIWFLSSPYALQHGLGQRQRDEIDNNLPENDPSNFSDLRNRAAAANIERSLNMLSSGRLAGPHSKDLLPDLDLR